MRKIGRPFVTFSNDCQRALLLQRRGCENLANHWTGVRNNGQEYWWNNMQILWTPHLPIIRRTPLQKKYANDMKHNMIEFEHYYEHLLWTNAPPYVGQIHGAREREIIPMSRSWCRIWTTRTKRMTVVLRWSRRPRWFPGLSRTFQRRHLEAIVHEKRVEDGRWLWENWSKGIRGVRMYFDI